MLNSIYTKVIVELKNAGSSMRCDEVKKHLTSLGFEVRDGKRGGHKVYTHLHLSAFTSGAFNCDHGKNPEIKKAYITKVIKVLKQHEGELIRYLEKDKR
jgi:hypothetical protein